MGDDFQTLFYILIGIIYLLSRVFKKKKPPKSAPPPVPGSDNQPAPSSSPPTTFEDLLREFGAEIPKEPEPENVYEYEPEPEPPPIPVEEDYSYRGLESFETDYDEEVEQNPYLRIPEEKRLHFERSENYKIRQSSNVFADKLADPQNVIDAIIYNEILNRKY